MISVAAFCEQNCDRLSLSSPLRPTLTPHCGSPMEPSANYCLSHGPPCPCSIFLFCYTANFEDWGVEVWGLSQTPRMRFLSFPVPHAGTLRTRLGSDLSPASPSAWQTLAHSRTPWGGALAHSGCTATLTDGLASWLQPNISLLRYSTSSCL